MLVYLVELVGLPPGASAPTLLRYASAEGYVTGPADTPANTPYAARVQNPGTFERHLWQPNTTRGESSVSLGLVDLVNLDNALDALLDWDFDGRACTILRGDTTAPRSTFSTIFRGTVAQVSVTQQLATIRLRDRAAEIAGKLLVATRYGGTDSGAQGVDGTPSDLQGKVQPRVLGECENFAPPRVNADTLIYQISTAPIAALSQVWYGGAPLAAGTRRANLGDLQANTPAAGAFDWTAGSATEGSYFRLGATPGSNTVTALAQEGATAADRTAAQIALRVFALAGVATADVLGVAALDAANPAPIGLYTGTDDSTVGAALDAICASVGASWTPNRLGQFQLIRLDPPAGPAAVTFAEWQIVGTDGITIQPTGDSDRGIPAYQVALFYAHNYTIQTGAQVQGVVDSTDPTRRDFLALADRTATASNPAIYDPATGAGSNPLSQPVTVSSLIRAQADAQNEATRLLGVYGKRPDGTQRRYLSFQLPREVAGDIDLGAIIALDTPRFGLAGRPLLLTGLQDDLTTGITTLWAWG